MEYIGYEEIWKYVYIKDEKTKYQVSNLGNVRNTKRNNKLLVQCVDKYGYNYVCLSHKSKHYHRTIHTLVAKAFIPNPDNKPQVNHKDGRKYHNYYKNLEWVTGKENVIHSYETGLHDNVAIGERHGNNKHKENDIKHVCKLLEDGQMTISDISKITKVPKVTIHDIISKKYWRHISDNYNISNYSYKKIKGIDPELMKKIKILAKEGKSPSDIRKILNLPYSDIVYSRIYYYVNKFKK